MAIGKLNRGMSVVDTFEILKGSPLSDEEYLGPAILGWCVELVSITCIDLSDLSLDCFAKSYVVSK